MRNAVVTTTNGGTKKEPLSGNLSAQEVQGEQEPGLLERQGKGIPSKMNSKDS